MFTDCVCGLGHRRTLGWFNLISERRKGGLVLFWWYRPEYGLLMTLDGKYYASALYYETQ